MPARLEAIELIRIELVLRAPFVTAHGVETTRDVVLVRALADDGGEGWGECSALSRPTYTGEYTAGAWSVLRDQLAPAVLAGRASGVVGHPMADAAIETARVDLTLRREGRSLTEHLGSASGPRPVTAVLGRAASIDELLERVGSRLAEGVVSIKLKITPGWDVEPLRAVRGAWPDVALAADANASYPSAAAVPAALDDLGLGYLEQPLAADALAATAQLAGRLGTPLALDESIPSIGALETAAALGATRLVNVKPARVGGPGAAADLVTRAHELGIEVFVGGMLETGVGRAAALAVAGLPECLATDLGPSAWYFDDDITLPIDLDDEGRIRPPDGAGLGVAPRPDRLAAATIDRTLVTR